MDTHLVGSLRHVHRRLDELMQLLSSLSDDVKEIREAGLAINFHVGSSTQGESEEESEESEESGESATTWP